MIYIRYMYHTRHLSASARRSNTRPKLRTLRTRGIDQLYGTSLTLTLTVTLIAYLLQVWIGLKQVWRCHHVQVMRMWESLDRFQIRVDLVAVEYRILSVILCKESDYGTHLVISIHVLDLVNCSKQPIEIE